MFVVFLVIYLWTTVPPAAKKVGEAKPVGGWTLVRDWELSASCSSNFPQTCNFGPLRSNPTSLPSRPNGIVCDLEVAGSPLLIQRAGSGRE